MKNISINLITGMLLSLLVTVVPGLSAAQGNSANGEATESPFACNRLALTPAQRKRHFDELGPQLRSLRKSFKELPNGYEFEFPSDSHSIQLVTEWAIGERACCPFFDIGIRMEREGGSLWLALTGRTGVKQFIEADGAAWIRR